jgi:dipeptidyl aminopeptidase/acylaminoacyl peptidase
MMDQMMKSICTIAVMLFCTLLAHAADEPADSKAIAPPPNLVADGIPPISREVADSVGRYTEFRAAFMLDWHPTERQMLITTRFANTMQVHRVKFPGGARTQLTFFPEPVGAASFPRKISDYFVLSKDIGGNEFDQNFRYDLADGNLTLLTDGKSRNSSGTWSRGGDQLAYTSTRRNGKDTDLYVVNPTDPKTDKMLVQLEGGGWGPLDWSPDDSKILLGEYVSVNESYLWLVDVRTGEKKIITPRSNAGAERIAYSGGKFTADGKGVFSATDKDSEFARLAYVDLESKEHKLLAADTKWDVEDFDLSSDGKLLAFVLNEDGASALRLIDTTTGKELPRPNIPVGVIASLKWHNNGHDLGFTLSSARSTADVYSLDVTSGKMDRWTESETGGLNPATFAEPKLVRWKSFDDREISGFLYAPSAERFPGKCPVIIDIHGGPEGQSRPQFLGRRNYLINELGIALIYPNVRGSSGYGKSFLKLDNAEKREDSVKDIGALLDWIKTQPDLDPDRIMITGGSYGGYMTLACAVHYNDRVRCSLDVVGISNFVSFLERTEAYRRDLRRVEYGDERDPKMRKFMEEIAPLNNAGKISKPLFIVQGKNDPRVPLNEAEQMVGTVKKTGTPVWYLMATDEGHGFQKKPNVDFQFYATVLFIKQFLLN